MILPLVTELLARVARRPVGRGGIRSAAAQWRRSAPGRPDRFGESAARSRWRLRSWDDPTFCWWISNQRAEALLEPVRCFYRAVTGKPGSRVAHLPAHEVLPYENRSPHAEISEDRAVALWRFARAKRIC